MQNKFLLFFLFGVLALVQLYVPAAMILDREEVLATGRAYKFQTAPVDPSDPFRGKYITLQYRHNSIAVADAQSWENGEVIYVVLGQDRSGFARIRQVFKERPSQSPDYVKARVAAVARDRNTNTLFIEYPFDRYYMEESLALPAEQAYAASLQDTTQVTYALVHIKGGNAVLTDVWIGGTPIREKVAGHRLKK